MRVLRVSVLPCRQGASAAHAVGRAARVQRRNTVPCKSDEQKAVGVSAVDDGVMHGLSVIKGYTKKNQ